MAEPWWKALPQDLHRIDERVSSLYIERCHIDRDDNAVIVINKERIVHIPAALIATLLIGPGTRITHAAIGLLADSATAVCWVGEGGVRFYASGIGQARGSRLLLRQAWLVTRPKERVAVARNMYAMRFPGEDVSGLTMQQLRGREGSRIKRLYRANSERTGVPWQRRDYKPGDAFAVGDDVNRVLSAANAALYGICHAVIAGIGASPALGFVHTGSVISFVLDIADLYKADYTIPLAFDLTAASHTSERDARIALRDRITEGGLLATIVHDVKNLLLPAGDDTSDEDLSQLWAEDDSVVDGGTNWASDLPEQSSVAVGVDLVVSGPELTTTEGGSG